MNDAVRVYAVAQSRDDRTLDIVESGRDGFVSDFNERKRIRDAIDAVVPEPGGNPVRIRTGKDWMAGFVEPDGPVPPGGRLRPVLFFAEGLMWRDLNVPALVASVRESVARLFAPSEISGQRMGDLQKAVSCAATRRMRKVGCLPAFCAIVAVLAAFASRFLS